MNDQIGEKPNSSEKPEPGSIGIVIAAIAMGLCCVGPVLFATVSFGAISAWFFDSGVLWALCGVGIAVVLFILYRRGIQNKRQSCIPSSDSKTNET